tara:strand:+ start:57 stop:272 length:216 start_codon:yes stop_codon:yes gene_type:complete
MVWAMPLRMRQLLYQQFKTVGPNGVVDTEVTVTGFLTAEAVNMDAAITIAQSDPFAAHAAIVVSEMMVMGG